MSYSLTLTNVGIALTKLYCYLPIRLDTCQDTRANKQLVLDNFEVLFKEVLQYGMVREATFDSLGFPDDQNDDGSTARRDATIVQEHCQEGKTCPTSTKRRCG